MKLNLYLLCVSYIYRYYEILFIIIFNDELRNNTVILEIIGSWFLKLGVIMDIKIFWLFFSIL